MSTLAKQVAEEQQDHVERRRQMVEGDPDTVIDATDQPTQPTQDEVAGDGATETDASGKEPKAEGALFDKSEYETEELALPKVDGQTIDRISVKLTGEIMLDRSDAADVALFRKLKLGRSVELRLAGKVSGSGGRGNTNREGDLDVIVGTKTIKADTVYVLDPNEL